jgi:hypothetical protein
MDEEELKQYREVQTCIKLLSEISLETREKIKEKMVNHSDEMDGDPIENIISCLTEIQYDVEQEFKELLNLNRPVQSSLSNNDSNNSNNVTSTAKTLQKRRNINR